MIVGIGGTTRESSTTERALCVALAQASARGASTRLFAARSLAFPMYEAAAAPSLPAARFLDAVRNADGLIIATPAYHGAMSGLLKNALDYLEELRGAPAPYLDGKAIGVIVSAVGPQASGTTLANVRAVVHALRGWPTPHGVTLISSMTDESDPVPGARNDLKALADQVYEFAARSATPVLPNFATHRVYALD